MAPMIFTKSIFKKEPLEIFNSGNMYRDFTYIDDVIQTIFRIIKKPPILDQSFDGLKPKPSKSWAPYQIFNIGNGRNIKLLDFINCIEKELGIKAIRNYKEMQLGDVQSTEADTKKINNFINFKPSTSIEEGIRKLVHWYFSYYNNI